MASSQKIQFQLSSVGYRGSRKHDDYNGDSLMNPLTAVFAATALAVTAGYAQAKDLGPDEALKLRDAGTIQSFEKLNAAALAKHPNATVTDTELEQEYGKYVYQVELRDAKGVEWDVELDAVSGQVLKDHQDT
jgi:uncharacterized membrane protein YkoI